MDHRKLVACTAALLLAAALVVASPAAARVASVEIDARYAFAGGRSYGSAGAYEVLIGRLHYAVDPEGAANRQIVDIAHAPRGAAGAVTFSGDFILLKPLDPGRGNRRLLLEVTNRGGLALLPFLNFASMSNRPETAGDGGDGLLFESGYSLLWTAWNWDVTEGNGRLQIALPIAEIDGRPITGRVVSELVARRPTTIMPVAWGNSRGYPASDPSGADARLTVRPTQAAPRREIPGSEWALLPGRAAGDPYQVRLETGFRPGRIYEISYRATAARVVGLGLAALRDAASFFKHATAAINPLAGRIDRVIGFGISQSARVLQHMLWQGFHRDEAGRRVFDAVFAHVPGGGKGSFNHRFAQTTRHPSQHEDHQYPADFFPFATVPQSDPVSGQTADLLARARGSMPMIFYTQTSTDYWTRSASLLHTDVTGSHDLGLDAQARLYVFTGAQHGVGIARSRGRFLLCRNPADYRFLLRALIVRLDDWLSGRRPPPASVYPTIAAGSLGSLAAYRRRFVALPGPNGPLAPPSGHLRPPRLDLGARFASAGIIDTIPPRFGPVFETRLPMPDGDAIDRGGIRPPLVAAPLGTHLGWNRRIDGARDAIGRWAGGYVPFARDRETAQRTGDPRPSLAERYGDRAGYVAAVEAAAKGLAQQGFLLDRDLAAILNRAARRFDRQTARSGNDQGCGYLR